MLLCQCSYTLHILAEISRGSTIYQYLAHQYISKLNADSKNYDKLTHKSAYSKLKTPPYLKKGDTVAITCPAKKLPHAITDAIHLLESWGLKVLLGETVHAGFNQYAGDDVLRTKDFQRFLDDNSVRAIFAARGGYGTIRIIDKIDFSSFETQPKWIVGFSDITVLHSHVFACFKTQSIHGQMPLTIPDGTSQSLETLRKALFNEPFDYQYESTQENKPGGAEGVLIGGNLTLLMTMSGSVSDMDYSDKVLFIEDVGEYLYSVDRMMWHLKRSGKLAKLKGMLVGGFTELKDNEIPFGLTAAEIIREHTAEYNFPVCFDFPAGHIENNHALILGKTVNLNAGPHQVHLTYLD